MTARISIGITGTNGFIGGELVRVCRALGFSVRCLPSKGSRWTWEDPPSVLVHLGALGSTENSLADPMSYFEHNLRSTVDWLEFCREHRTPIIFASTVKVYPGVDGRLTPYGLTKRAAEDYVRLYGDIYGVPFVINRISSVYGPTQVPTSKLGWFTWMIHAARTGQPITVHGDGSQSRDVLYIDDLIALLLDQIRHHDIYSGMTLDVGGGLPGKVSINELLAELDYSGISYAELLPGELAHVLTDNTAVTDVRGWHPTVDWRTGLQLMREAW
jgi:nucleoside-diphosphate-sugar epimerase